MLRFIHFSDIHFKSPLCNTPALDPDIAIRDAVLQDLQAQFTTDIKTVDGIFITGDIAFAGREDEYVAARGWLQEISAELNIPVENIYIVPGNHDVDRLASDEFVVKSVRKEIRGQGSFTERNSAITEALASGDASKAIFSPMKNYIDFSEKYGCEISSELPFWQKGIALSEHVELNIRGITTSLFSNKHDSKGNLILGGSQFQFRKLPGYLNVSLMHHPCDWIVDGDDLTDLLSNSVHIQLFGHKHRARWDVSDNTLRVSAISLHPDRGEGSYEPGYNIIEIEETNVINTQSLISVKITVRKLEQETLLFRSRLHAEGREFISYELKVNIAKTKKTKIQPSPTIETPVAISIQSEVTPAHNQSNKSTCSPLDMREASRLFAKLARSDRDQILIDCQLLRSEELNQADIDKQIIGFRRASVSNQEELLCRQILKVRGNSYD